MFLAIFLLAQVMAPFRFVDRIPEPAAQVEFPPQSGRVAVKWYTLSLVGTAPTNGDNDGYADADETLDMTLTLVNGPVALTNLVVTLATGDATVECVNTAQVTIPSVAAGATVTTPPFRFKVAGPGIVDRTDIHQPLNANFDVKMRSDQFVDPLFLQRRPPAGERHRAGAGVLGHQGRDAPRRARHPAGDRGEDHGRRP